MDYKVRKATHNDQVSIARTVAYSYKKEVASLSKDTEHVARAFTKGINTNRFWIAEQDNETLGIAACSDYSGRAFTPSRSDCIKYFGFIRGSIGYRLFRGEFASTLKYPSTTGYIEFVGVLEKARGRGIAKAILSEIIEQNVQYSEFVLDVVDTNEAAIKSYQGIGFQEFKRVAVKFPKIMEFNSKIYMKYTKSQKGK